MNFYKLKLNSSYATLDPNREISNEDILFFKADTSVYCAKALAQFCMLYTFLGYVSEFNSAIANVFYSDYNFDDVNIISDVKFITNKCSISASSEKEYQRELDKLLISENVYNILIITYDRNKNSISVSKNFASCDD